MLWRKRTSMRPAHDILERLANIFGEDRLFLELQDFAVPHQPKLNDLARQMSERMGLKRWSQMMFAI